MKNLLVCTIALAFCMNTNAQQGKEKVKVKTDVGKSKTVTDGGKTKTVTKGSANGMILKTAADSFSYAVGVSIAENMKESGVSSINGDFFKRAVEDVFQNRTKLMSLEACNMFLQQQMQAMNEKKNHESMSKAGEEKVKGAAFLAENKKRKEITALPNGLQYEVLRAGDPSGVKPKAIDTVVVHYTGTLLDGTKFDSSVDRGQPASFPLNGVIKGWTEILQLMPKGAKWKVYIPSDMAYGDQGAGGVIKPGSTLVFDIDLIDVKPAH